ncbi:MAG: GNAT family N-acetyltransferase [Planctomycetota bacterium]|jgi:ribosomal protein S18 acetylase RimI-like enzyme
MISYHDEIDALRAEDLVGFFEGWPDPPSAETHLAVLRGSSAVVIARDEADGTVVGFVTAVSDGVLSAYIPLLEVLPSHRGRGIGAELVRRITARLSPLYMIDLLCDADVQPFYRKLGFQDVTGMARRDRAAL